MIIIGVDPGTVVTGYGIIEVSGSSYKAIDYGCIRPPPSLKLSDRYLIISNGLEELVGRYSPHAMSIETQFVYKNPDSAIKLGMARGVAVVAARKKQVSVYEYAPTKVKLAVVGNGRASKYQVKGMIKMLLRLSKEPPADAADALALAICHAHALRYRKIKEF